MPYQTLVQQAFVKHFDYPAQGIWAAPGRVNLIGDHTDYNDGFVLPAAIDFATYVAAAKRNDHRVRVVALDLDGQLGEINLAEIRFNTEQMWLNYVAGTIQALLTRYPQVTGADIVVSGNVPLGAGLSSSASFEIALLKALSSLYGLTLDGELAAKLGQSAENDFVGCNCGIMDQFISAQGKAKHAMLLDCRSLDYQHSPLPDGLQIVIINSNVKRGLVDSQYNARRAQCESVARALGKRALRDVSMAELMSNKDKLDEQALLRARHVISENTRTEQAVLAMQNNDIAQLSQLMRASHLSLQQDFEVSTKELDGLVAIVQDVVGERGGVRMTGGGFGGCVVALVPDDLVPLVKTRVNALYPAQFGLVADIYQCTAVDGAFSL